MTGSLRRLAAAACVTALASFPVGVAQTLHVPIAPTDKAVARQWVNPDIRPTDTATKLSVNLDDITPDHPVIGQPIRFTVTVSNNTGKPVHNLQVRLQRAAPALTADDIRAALTADQAVYGWAAPFHDLPTTLSANESITFTATLATGPAAGAPGKAGDDEPIGSTEFTDSLGITEPGSYPILVNVNGRIGDGMLTYLASERTAITLDPVAAPNATATIPRPPGLTLLWPITARTNILAGETGEAPLPQPLVLTDEALTTTISPGGRLYELVDTYVQATATPDGADLAAAVCLAVDPALVDTVTRMTAGYTVATDRGNPASGNHRLKDRWQVRDEPIPATQGTGRGAAGTWLELLKKAASRGCTVALPWGNADVDAVARTGSRWLMTEALARGTMTVARALSTSPLSQLVIPGSGYVSVPTAPALRAAAGGPNLSTLWEESQPAHRDGGKEGSLSDTVIPGGVITTDPVGVSDEPVSVLVSSNTVWGTPRAGRFAQLSTGVRAVTFPAGLGAMLAHMGPSPLTVGYTDPVTRFDVRVDSAAARRRAALAALDVTVAAAGPHDTVIAVPPAAMPGGADAAALLKETKHLLAAGTARPVPLPRAITPDPATDEVLARGLAATPKPAAGTPPPFGVPYFDPAAPADTEVLRATQQANYIDDLTRIMVNDPQIALTRFGFTEPLLADLLRALTVTDRQSMSRHTDAVGHADTIFTANRAMLQKLRSSVALLPPSTVYTRTGQSSPLLIVGRNGLPLPVDTRVTYTGPKDASLKIPATQRIPAKGSITVSFTATLPDKDRTKLTLWLATPDGAAISNPVEIWVQTRAGIIGTPSTRIIISLLIMLLLLRISVTARRARRRRAVVLPRTAQTAHPEH